MRPSRAQQGSTHAELAAAGTAALRQIRALPGDAQLEAMVDDSGYSFADLENAKDSDFDDNAPAATETTPAATPAAPNAQASAILDALVDSEQLGPAERGKLTVKQIVDPNNVMNPGKLCF